MQLELSTLERRTGATFRSAAMLACALIGLAACDRLTKDPAEPAQTEGAEEAGAARQVQRVAASDTIGEGLPDITGVAFWTHPTLSFEGMAIAATSDGLVGLVIENGAEAARASGFAATGVAVSYLGEGAGAQGYAAASVEGDPAFKFYAIDNVTREFLLKPTMFIAEKTEGGFCFGRTADGDELALHQATGAGLTSHRLGFSNGGVAARGSERRQFERGLVDCVVDDATGDVYALDAEGGLVRFGDGARGERLPGDSRKLQRAYRRGALGLVLSESSGNGDASDADAALSRARPERRISLARLSSKDGVVDVFDGPTGADLGAIRLGETFDDDGVSRSATLGVGYGNFGGVYRDGVIALVVAKDDGSAEIRLAPWGGVSSALGQATGMPVDPRAPRPASITPELRIELPQP